MFVFYYRNVIIIVRRTNEKMLNNMKIIEIMTYSFSFFISFGNAKKKKITQMFKNKGIIMNGR